MDQIHKDQNPQFSQPFSQILTMMRQWKIHDKDSINTSFPSFLNIIKKISSKP